MYKKSLVAFIDILGFKEMVNRSSDNQQDYSLLLETLMRFHDLEKPEAWTIDLIEVEEDA